MFSLAGTPHRRHVGAVASVLAVFLIVPAVRAQPTDSADGVTFDDRFLIDGQVAPTFTRPEVVQLFSTMPASEPKDEAVASSVAGDQPHRLGPLGQIIFAEPKGPAKVLTDLLNTPVKELLVTRAEAGPDVPPPQDASSAPPHAPPEAASVLARAADPISERPTNTDPLAMPAPSAAQSNREGAVPPSDQAEAQGGPPETSREVAAAPTPPSGNSEPVDTAAVTRDEEPADPSFAAATNAAGAEPPTRTAEVSSTGAAKGRRIGTGRAAWYQHPGRTASGEKFDPNQHTAAHRTLPFGTHMRVVSEQTGRSVVVRINDRIPRAAKIMIDLSRGSAKAIGLVGTGRVSLYDLADAGDAPLAKGRAQPSLATARSVKAVKPQDRASSFSRAVHLARRGSRNMKARPQATAWANPALTSARTRSLTVRPTRMSEPRVGSSRVRVAPADVFASGVGTYRASSIALGFPESLKPTTGR